MTTTRDPNGQWAFRWRWGRYEARRLGVLESLYLNIRLWFASRSNK